MKYNALYIAILLLLAVWGLYFGSFHGTLSEAQGDWGTFGDFTGGVVNPLLNFITIYLLITQYRTSRDDIVRERKEGDIKAFEGSFFTFTTIALNEYRDFELKIDGVDYKAAKAVSMIQKHIEGSVSPKKALVDLDHDAHDGIYSLVAGFCVVFRLIQDSCPAKAKEKYTQTLSMLLPIKITYLLCICDSCTDWAMLEHPGALGYFKKDSVKLVHDHYVGVSSR